MLRHIGEPEAAWKIRNAIDDVYRDRSKLTRDVGRQRRHRRVRRRHHRRHGIAAPAGRSHAGLRLTLGAKRCI